MLFLPVGGGPPPDAFLDALGARVERLEPSVLDVEPLLGTSDEADRRAPRCAGQLTLATARSTSLITCGEALPKRKLKTPKS